MEGRKEARRIANDDNPELAKKIFKEVMYSAIPGMMNDSDIYVFTSYQVLEDWMKFTRELFTPFGFKYKAILTWEKVGPGMGDTNSWGMACEFILYYKRGSWEPYAPRRNAVLHFPQLRPKQLIHPHQKPTSLLDALIKHSTKPGDFIIDPFCGSGSTIVAARDAGRSAVGIELDDKNYERASKHLAESEGGLF